MLDSQRHLSPPSPPHMPPAPPLGVTARPNRGSTAGTQQMAVPLPTVASQVVTGSHQVASSTTTAAAISGKMASRAPSSTATCPLPPLPAPPAVSHRPGVPPTPVTALGYRESGAPTLTEIVRDAYEKGFSDVHLGVGEIPRYRNRGEIEVTSWPETDRQTFYDWMHEILSDDEVRRFENQLDYDGATQYEFTRVRVNIFDSLLGPAMVLRLIPIKIPTIEQLGLPPVFKDVCHYQKGLILVTGPTGSGKSTTLAAMIDYINKEMPKNIITIEDPIEFVHKSQKALIKHREVGIHTHKFDMALKAALREDPDVILIGEMRDRETVNTALKAAQTGHLVLGTLHTNGAVKTIERILQLYEPDQQLPMRLSVAESLVGVISQSLCRTTDGKRTASHEILINTDAVKDYIRRGEIDEIEQLMPKCTFDGMCTMNQSLYKLYEMGRITEETALELSPKQNEMAQALRGRI